MKTAELIGHPLDWLVAKCEGRDWPDNAAKFLGEQYYNPSTDWSQGGPIIDRERITTSFNPDFEVWEADITNKEGDAFIIGHGPTPLIAAMRCFIASRLGDEVEIPEDLK